MRRVVIIFFLLAFVLGIPLSYVYWPNFQHEIHKLSVDKVEEAKDLAKTRELLNNSKPEEAFELIQKYSDGIDYTTELGKEWLDLLIRASEATLNTPQLIVLYEYYPKAFDSHEKAALLVADAYLIQGRSQEYQALRDSWKGRETKPETWFVLDADRLLLDGKRNEAIDYLNSRSYAGKADTARLIRLALLYIFEQPKVAWDYLTQAYNKDPENPEIRSYRGKLLETVGKNSLAMNEYLAAVKTEPNNLYLRDQLAEFYLRNKQYPQALQVWLESLKPPSLDFIWLKVVFWNRVVSPVKFDWNSTKVPQGKLEPLIDYMLTLSPSQFWDTASFEKLPDSQQYLKTQQATYWLRLIAALKDYREKEAYDLLLFNPFQGVSWNPKLEEELKRILVYRKTDSLLPLSSDNKLQAAKDEPVLFEQIDSLAKNSSGQVPDDLRELLKGPDAFAAAFLAAGWNEAAIQLHSVSVIPPEYPEWYSYDLAQAIKQNRSVKAALNFAAQQPSTPQLSLLTGELLISAGQTDAALAQLTPYAQEDSDVGYRAAWLISLIYIDHAQYDEAEATIRAQPRLASDLLGQETLARIALLEGKTDLADQLYTALESNSAEAKSFLARKAFEQKEWKRARELTEQLITLYPTNTLLKDNLKKIIQEQNKAMR